ncbi:MAG: RidA family protein [Candidatus Lokiarchaeota archaeon]|nr:RidA family protein [Candidatus Lokiarchaeota archaeon]
MGEIKYVDTGAPMSSPYSPGLVVGNTLYVSGQVPVGKDGKIPSSIEEQTAVVLANLKTIVEKAGARVSSVVRCTVFMTDISEFKQMNNAYKQFFEENGATHFPTRTTVQVTKLAVDAARIEVDCICSI